MGDGTGEAVGGTEAAGDAGDGTDAGYGSDGTAAGRKGVDEGSNVQAVQACKPAAEDERVRAGGYRRARGWETSAQGPPVSGLGSAGMKVRVCVMRLGAIFAWMREVAAVIAPPCD